LGACCGLITPPRPPPPVILPGAAFASLCLAGAFAPGFALRARAAACFWTAPVIVTAIEIGIASNVAEWKRNVFVIFDSWFAGWAIEQDCCGVDAGLHSAELLLA